MQRSVKSCSITSQGRKHLSAHNLRQTNVKLQSEKIIYVRAWNKEKRRRNKDDAYLKHRTDMNHPPLYKSTMRSIFTLCRALLLKCTLRWDDGPSETLHANHFNESFPSQSLCLNQHQKYILMRLKSHVRALRFSSCLSTNIDSFSFKLQIQQLVRKLKFKFLVRNKSCFLSWCPWMRKVIVSYLTVDVFVFWWMYFWYFVICSLL